MKTAIINARVKPELKNDVEKILAQLGISTTQAITMFFEQIKLNRGIPFELKLYFNRQQYEPYQASGNLRSQGC